MSQSLTQNLIHLIFSTKDREPLLDPVQKELHAYLASVLNHKKCTALKVGGTADHVHLLFDLSRMVALAQVVGEVKIASSKWLKLQREELQSFRWQKGYGGFSVSQSGRDEVIRYIENQKEHHETMSFQEEFRKLLIRHELRFDEKYVWD